MDLSFYVRSQIVVYDVGFVNTKPNISLNFVRTNTGLYELVVFLSTNENTH